MSTLREDFGKLMYILFCICIPFISALAQNSIDNSKNCIKIVETDSQRISEIKFIRRDDSLRQKAERTDEAWVRKHSAYEIRAYLFDAKESLINSLDLDHAAAREIPGADVWGVIEITASRSIDDEPDMITVLLIDDRWYEKRTGCSNYINSELSALISFGGS